jgi:hypothetical protein
MPGSPRPPKGPRKVLKKLGAAFNNILQDKVTMETLTQMQVWVDDPLPEEYERLMGKSEALVAERIKIAKIMETK